MTLWYEGRGPAVAEGLNVPTQIVYERAKVLDISATESSGGDKYEWKERPTVAGI